MRCMRLAANTGRKKVAKNRHLSTIAQLCRAISSQLRHISTIGKKLLSTNLSSTRPLNMVNFGPLTAEIGSGVWAPLQISAGFASWQRYCMASSNGRQANFAVLNRGRHLCSAGRPSGWALAHIQVLLFFPRLISAVGDWMSTILPQMVWPQLLSPYVIGQTIIFSSCFFFLLLLSSSSSFFPRLISAVGNWMFTILWHMMWP